MKQYVVAIMTLGLTVQAVSGPLKSKALMPAPIQAQAPIGMLPYTGAPTAGSIPTPYYGQTFGVQPIQATGSYAYTPGQMPMTYGMNPMMGQQMNPQMQQMCMMNPAACNPMLAGPMPGMPGMMPGMIQPAGPQINPALMMAALAALPGLFSSSSDSSTTDSSTERYRPSRSSRSESDLRPIPPRTARAGSTRKETNDVTEQPAPTRSPAPQRREPPAELSRNEVTSTITRIEAANTQMPTATSPGTSCVPDPTCADCCQNGVRAEQCTSANGYLEAIVGSSANETAVKIAKAHSSASGSIACVREAMKSVNNDRVQFVSCPASAGVLGSPVERPCASDNMVKTMAGAYEIVSDCLAGYLDPKADKANGQSVRASIRKSMFQAWNYESGWAPNAARKSGNSSSAGGPGQLVEPVIELINEKTGGGQSQFEKMKAYISASPLRACKAMARYDFQPLKADRANSCGRIAMDNGNPMLNMMYSMAYMRGLRNRAERHLDGVQGISPATRNRLLGDLMIWGQGAGGELVASTLAKVVKKHGSKLTGPQINEQKYADFIAEMRQELKLALADYKAEHPGAAINPEADSRYLERTQIELSNLNSRVNGNCGVF